MTYSTNSTPQVTDNLEILQVKGNYYRICGGLILDLSSIEAITKPYVENYHLHFRIINFVGNTYDLSFEFLRSLPFSEDRKEREKAYQEVYDKYLSRFSEYIEKLLEVSVELK